MFLSTQCGKLRFFVRYERKCLYLLQSVTVSLMSSRVCVRCGNVSKWSTCPCPADIEDIAILRIGSTVVNTYLVSSALPVSSDPRNTVLVENIISPKGENLTIKTRFTGEGTCPSMQILKSPFISPARSESVSSRSLFMRNGSVILDNVFRRRGEILALYEVVMTTTGALQYMKIHLTGAKSFLNPWVMIKRQEFDASVMAAEKDDLWEDPVLADIVVDHKLLMELYQKVRERVLGGESIEKISAEYIGADEFTRCVVGKAIGV